MLSHWACCAVPCLPSSAHASNSLIHGGVIGLNYALRSFMSSPAAMMPGSSTSAAQAGQCAGMAPCDSHESNQAGMTSGALKGNIRMDAGNLRKDAGRLVLPADMGADGPALTQGRQTLTRSGGRSLTQRGWLRTQHGPSLTQHGRPLTQHGRSLTQHGRPLTQHGRSLNQHGRSLNQHGRSLTHNGRSLTQHGLSLTQRGGRSLAQHGVALTQQRDCALPSGTAARAFSSPAGEKVTFDAQGLPLRTGRPRLVVLGTGWAGASLVRYINPQLYDITVISPRNHMVFTPLLASTTVGTLEARAVAVHITDLQKALFDPQNYLYIADATTIHTERQAVECVSQDKVRFFVEYDRLVVATGSQGSTFGIPGVLEHCHFLRDVKQAEAIRQHLIDNVALAGIPGRDMAEWQRLLHIVIVGGGPTGVEVAGELSDFINRDLMKLYPDRAKATRITLIEAKELLGSFDGTLREYAARKLRRQGVVLKKGVVKEATAKEIRLMDNTTIPFGLCIWSTGVGPTPFVTSLPFAKTPMGRLAVDSHLRVLAPRHYKDDPPIRPESGAAAQDGQSISQLGSEADSEGTDSSWVAVPHVFALGDCCANLDKPLPALAQVAEQQGRYLAESLNKEARNLDNLPTPGFVYRHLGSMATVGSHSAVLELDNMGPRRFNMAGFWSWVAWRSAYLTRLGSIRARLVVALNWSMTLVFGRDMSRW